MMRNQTVIRAIVTLAALSAIASSHADAAEAVTAPLASQSVKMADDSGLVEQHGLKPGVVFSTDVRVPDATWLRVRFGDVLLAGDSAEGTESYLLMTSLADGATQVLDAASLAQWRNKSAYFVGDSVRVELVAEPGTGLNRVTVVEAIAGMTDPAPRSICGPTDDRMLSNDPRAGRAAPVGCSAWLIDDANHCFLTAGHCASGGSLDVMWFNVPLSGSDGSSTPPPPEDQYPVDLSSIQFTNGGVGNDWCYFGCFENSTTGLTPFEAQGDFYTLVLPPPVQGQTIRITGYGTVSSPVSPTWNGVQKTHTGPYDTFAGTALEYTVDTTGGNSGSPVINEDTGEAIGIHTHGGCSGSSGNNGTASSNSGLQQALANPLGVCIPSELDFSYPAGLPELIDPAGGTTVRVEVLPNSDIVPEPGTGQLHYDIGTGFVTVAMQEVSDNVYDAVFPPADCGGIVLYYVSAESTAGVRYTDPRNAPDDNYSAPVGSAITIVAAYDFESAVGWTVENVDLADGAWDRGIPVDNGRGDPQADFDQSGQCFLTDNDAFEVNSDVDGGPTRLISPTFDLSGTVDPQLNYARWFTNSDSDGDRLDVEISDDGGQSWSLIESVPHTIGWVMQSIRVSDHVAPTSQVKVRFSATDNPNDSVTEGGIDAFSIADIECGDIGEVLPPDELTIARGQVVAGGLDELAESDDEYLVVNRGIALGPLDPPVRMVLAATAATAAPSQLRFALEASVNTPGVTQKIEMFNYDTQNWEEMDVRGATTTDTVAQVIVSSDPARFIDPDTLEMKVQASWRATGPVLFFIWRVQVDAAAWTLVE